MLEIDALGTFNASRAAFQVGCIACPPAELRLGRRCRALVPACLPAPTCPRLPAPARPRAASCTQALKASGDGVIINISMTLHYGATWWQSHACAAKARRLCLAAASGHAVLRRRWVPARLPTHVRAPCSPAQPSPLPNACLPPGLAQAAVDALTRNLGLEWGPFGIRTAGVAPGPIEGTAGARVCGVRCHCCCGRLCCV